MKANIKQNSCAMNVKSLVGQKQATQKHQFQIRTIFVQIFNTLLWRTYHL